MRTIEDNKAVNEAATLSEVMGEKVVTVEREKHVAHIIHIVAGGIAVGATVFLHVPIITYALCAVYVASGVILLNRCLKGNED